MVTFSWGKCQKDKHLYITACLLPASFESICQTFISLYTQPSPPHYHLINKPNSLRYADQ